uniref:uncharacterized protein LOC129497440 isoform X2 n=1 Tax=Nyctereutes procyonoides TaxID=34880 RepID=UPI0024444B2B|nr:uncharacterized protein LOC129497440 isoform X2 [Nyctereutes procyonoides]XP_055162300.1 uncharacterized protein LOC129497440 isoform X2 [Nyctereutes procyonoides]
MLHLPPVGSGRSRKRGQLAVGFLFLGWCFRGSQRAGHLGYKQPHKRMPCVIPGTVNMLHLTAVIYSMTVDEPDRITSAPEKQSHLQLVAEEAVRETGASCSGRKQMPRGEWPRGTHGRTVEEPPGMESRPRLTASCKMGSSIPLPQGHGFC